MTLYFTYNESVSYEWDEAKQVSNKHKHGVDFWAVVGFDWDSALVKQSPFTGEPRCVGIGYIENRLHCVVFTERERRIRVISLRKASRREGRSYEESR